MDFAIGHLMLYVEFLCNDFRTSDRCQTATEALCQLNYAHNRNAKRLQVFNGILYYNSGASQTVLDHASRVGITPSYNNIHQILEELSKDEAKKVQAIGREAKCGLDLVFDNVQTYAKQWEKRIGREDTMKVGMAATAVELNNFKPEAVKLERRRQLINEGKTKKLALTTEDILGLLDVDHSQTIGALHWLQILVTYIPQLERYKGEVQNGFRTEPRARIRLESIANGGTDVHRARRTPIVTIPLVYVNLPLPTPIIISFNPPGKTIPCCL